MDEPTNHLDITSKEILESALLSYTGTVLYVSHDRYFINRTATRILDLERGVLLNYIGNYDYYLEKKADIEKKYFGFSLSETPAAPKTSDRLTNHRQLYSGLSSNTTSQTANSSDASDSLPKTSVAPSGKQDWLLQKEEQARERKRQNDLKKVESEIENLETRDADLDAMLSDESVYSNPARLLELNTEKSDIAARLERLMEQWEELSSQ